MSNRSLYNYLHMHRLRAGLSQDEVAYLLGARKRTMVSRHETFQREPGLMAVLAYELVYGAPARVLFEGEYEEVEARVRRQAATLLEGLEGKPPSAALDQKRRTLGALAYPDDPVIVPVCEE